jgi:hypothetical protein
MKKKFLAIIGALITGGLEIAMTGLVTQTAEAGRMLN